MKIIDCTALRAFTQYVPEYGMVHGNPDSEDSKNVGVPETVLALLIEEEKVRPLDAGHEPAPAPQNLPQLDHDGDGLPGGSRPDALPPLTGKNKAALIVIAIDEHVALEEGMTNPQIIAAIEKKRADDLAEPLEEAPAS